MVVVSRSLITKSKKIHVVLLIYKSAASSKNSPNFYLYLAEYQALAYLNILISHNSKLKWLAKVKLSFEIWTEFPQ